MSIETGTQGSFSVVPAQQATALPRTPPLRYQFWVPEHWRAPITRNPYAQDAQRGVLEWFASLGCTAGELKRASRFDAAGYVGVPFPFVSEAKTHRLARYLSLWLLWDDVHVESLQNRWRIGAQDIIQRQPPPGMTRFDQGWWQLFGEFSQCRSRRWIEDVCRCMETWSDAAADEARIIVRAQDGLGLPTFEEQLGLRIATIGMFATVYLLEDAYDHELPVDFHTHPTVLRIKVLANQIVGLGNDIFSCGKDCAEGKINLVTTLMQQNGMSAPQALEHLIELHDASLQEYDRLATTLRSWSCDDDPYIARWVQDVRYASIGFTLWESQAPRYSAHKLVVAGQVIEPSFLFVPALAEGTQAGTHVPAPMNTKESHVTLGEGQRSIH